jgi:manganese/zinc/iron transport system permease protein
MGVIEQLIVDLFLNVVTIEQFNAFTRDPRSVAILVGVLVSLSGAWTGVYLLLRKMSLTSDAISHTVLFGIVTVFLIMVALGIEPRLNSPWLLIGATGAGVLTVVLTEILQRSGLVKSDAALGLVFPLLFALGVIGVSRFAEDVHIDIDAVLLGEIGLAWADSNSYCYDNCADVTITPDDPRAETGRNCTNCSRGGISPRDPEAEFETVCTNCGTYTAAEAWGERLIDAPPQLAYFPQSVTVMLLITLLNGAFITLFYKELKLVAFDEQLARALGFRPAVLTYALMTLVSLTAVGAFDAVGAILVVSFFVIPPASAYLLTDRLGIMLLIAPLFGIAGSVAGYEFARGSFLGLPVDGLLVWLDGLVGLGGYTEWNVSISASIVVMTFVFFGFVWVLSPRYGLAALVIRRRRRRRRFRVQMLLAHIAHHTGTPEAADELAPATLHEHLNWPRDTVESTLRRAKRKGFVHIDDDMVLLTDAGEDYVRRFRQQHLKRGQQNDRQALAAVGD